MILVEDLCVSVMENVFLALCSSMSPRSQQTGECQVFLYALYVSLNAFKVRVDERVTQLVGCAPFVLL